MKQFKLFIQNIFVYLFQNRYLYSILVSFGSLSVLFFSIIKQSGFILKYPIFFLELSFDITIYFSSAFVLLFLPFFPLIFNFFKNSDFSYIEKIGITIISNLSFYIIIGYIGYFFQIKISALFFLFSCSLSFFLIVFLQWFYNKYSRKVNKINKNHQKIEEKRDKILGLLKFKKSLSVNGILLGIFILFLCFLNIVKGDYFYGTDPWLHISLIKIITEMQTLPVVEYYGTLGLHIFCSAFHFFTNINIILIPKYFVFYTIPLSGFIFYIFLKNIFRNKNLAVFGVFILQFSSLGFDYMMFQFWPSSIVIIQYLGIFYLLYKRFLNLFKLNGINKKAFIIDSVKNYSLITLIFISTLLTHALTSIILLFSFLWVYFVYFLRDRKKGFDFIFLISLTLIFLLFFISGIGSRHFWFLERVSSMPLTNIVLITALTCSIICFVVWQLIRSIDFDNKGFFNTIKGKDNMFLKRIEDKYIIPIAIGTLLLFTTLFILGNIFIFYVNFSFILSIAQTIFIITFGLWGIIIFQKKTRGKFIIIWLVGFFLMLMGVISFDILISGERYFDRIFYMMAPIIVIGFISYLYKLILIKKIQKRGIKFLLLSFIIFSLFASFYQSHIAYKDVSLSKQEVSGIEWYSNHNSQKSVIITEFGFNYIFIFFDYPYNESEPINTHKTHYFIFYKLDLFPPENHFNETGDNILKAYKQKYNSNVYITIDNQYYLNVDLKPYGYLSDSQLEEYYQLRYVNKIHSSKSTRGEEYPLYWII